MSSWFQAIQTDDRGRSHRQAVGELTEGGTELASYYIHLHFSGLNTHTSGWRRHGTFMRLSSFISGGYVAQVCSSSNTHFAVNTPHSDLFLDP